MDLCKFPSLAATAKSRIGLSWAFMKNVAVMVCLALLASLPAGAGEVKVAVLPFDVLGEAGHEWVGRAMQDALASGVQNVRGISAVAVPAVSPIDASAALTAARSAGADFVIYGTIQFVDDQMRVSGHVAAVASGQIIGSLVSDSNLRDLFVMEDSLARRAGLLISPPPAQPAPATSPRPEIQLVGPPLSTRQSRYFDGDLSSVTAVPERFRNEYDRYYYHPLESDPALGWGGYFGGGGAGGWGGAIMQTSVGAVGTW
jgi:TolB-like protein